MKPSMSENYQTLAKAINDAWIKCYGGEPVDDMFALTMRVKNIADDRECWAFNARVLQKAFNELVAKFNGRREC